MDYHEIAAKVYGGKAYELVESHEVSVYPYDYYKIFRQSPYVVQEDEVIYGGEKYFVVRYGGLRKVVDRKVYITEKLKAAIHPAFGYFDEASEETLDALWAERKQLIAEEKRLRGETD